MSEIQRFASHYDMSHPQRGLAIILNHEKFDRTLKLRQRHGTNVDCSRLREALEGLHFEVSDYPNLNLNSIHKVMESISGADHSDYDCLLVAILSHGGCGYINANDSAYKLADIMGWFTANQCPTLAGKPKIFVVQACRGSGLDDGIILPSNIIDVDQPDQAECDWFDIPRYQDFLVAYSTIPGHYSWRNSKHGSWFIRSLCDELEKSNNNSNNLLTMLTSVLVS